MEPRNRIDEWLDKGLAEYGNAEPRAGLENRILANLSAEKNRMSGRRRWWWALSAVSAVVVVVVSVWLGTRPNQPRAPARENKAARVETFERAGETPAQMSTGSPSGKLANSTGAGDRDAHSSRSRMANRPELDQFPSARPLSDQVKLLLEYVNATPRDEISAVIARAKDTSDLQVRDLEIPPLDGERPASESSETN